MCMNFNLYINLHRKHWDKRGCNLEITHKFDNLISIEHLNSLPFIPTLLLSLSRSHSFLCSFWTCAKPVNWSLMHKIGGRRGRSDSSCNVCMCVEKQTHVVLCVDRPIPFWLWFRVWSYSNCRGLSVYEMFIFLISILSCFPVKTSKHP